MASWWASLACFYAGVCVCRVSRITSQLRGAGVAVCYTSVQDEYAGSCQTNLENRSIDTPESQYQVEELDVTLLALSSALQL